MDIYCHSGYIYIRYGKKSSCFVAETQEDARYDGGEYQARKTQT